MLADSYFECYPLLNLTEAVGFLQIRDQTCFALPSYVERSNPLKWDVGIVEPNKHFQKTLKAAN